MEDYTETPEMAAPATVPVLHHSEAFSDIYEAFIKAQAHFTTVPKNKTAKVRSNRTGAEYTYKYADLADVLGMARPILNAEGIGILQPHVRVNGRLRVCTRLIHKSGQWIMSDGLELPHDVSPQDLGTGSTYYRRYDACSLLGIVADEDVDAIEPSRGEPTPIQQPASPQKHRAAAEPPATTGQSYVNAREAIVEEIKTLVPDPHELGRKAQAMFPQHRSTRTLTIDDLKALLAKVKADAAPPPADVPDEIAEMFESGAVTTASRISGPTIGKGLANRLHKLVNMSKVHTEKEFEENFVTPLGITSWADLPRDLYDGYCSWAEGQPLDGTPGVEDSNE